MVFDIPDSAAIPAVVEPTFMHLDAEVEVVPVMNAEELGRGLQEFAQTA
jgi:hypothetical protein